MKSYTTLRNLFGSLTGDTSTTNLTLGDQLLNDGYRKALRAAPSLREKTSTLSVTASTQFVELPYDCLQVMPGVKVTRSSTVYTPREAPSRDFWNSLNESTVYSDTPEWYFIDDNQIGFFPIPSTSGTNVVTVPYKRRIKDLSIADYITGGVQALANAATAITGTGTTWTASMVGRYIRITESDTANKGDGEWYEIGSYSSATSIGLIKAYNGTTISAGNAAFTIGQMPILHEDYHDLPVKYALWQYWDAQDGSDAAQKASQYKGEWEQGLKDLKADFGNKTSSRVVEDDETSMDNPNLYVSL